ncbi:MAG: hypothetical protein UT22_C0021G0018, partial [Parcubacteria group bacterium GW2011_GWC2_39_11]
NYRSGKNYGYYIDHIIDGLAVMIFSFGLGLSGFVKIEIALVFAIMYLLLMIHVELVTFVQNEFRYSFGLIGPTEMRIIGVMFTVAMFFLPIIRYDVYGHSFTQYDIGLVVVSIIMFLILLFSSPSSRVFRTPIHSPFYQNNYLQQRNSCQ